MTVSGSARRRMVFAMATLAAAAATGVDAQSNYPQRPVRMVVPFAPGGASDFVGRDRKSHV